MSEEMLKRAVNVGFSGGEKKRNEVLQMAVLEPRFCVLDETDSGLDIDALRIVAEGVNALRGPERSMLVITHYQRLLDYIRPDRVHVLAGGKIERSGGPELARELEAKGYGETSKGTAACHLRAAPLFLIGTGRCLTMLRPCGKALSLFKKDMDTGRVL